MKKNQYIYCSLSITQPKTQSVNVLRTLCKRFVNGAKGENRGYFCRFLG